MVIGPCDQAVVSGQLDRTARDVTGIAVRCPFGYPAVIETAPVLAGGEPNPTLLYLTCPTLVSAISEVEAAGGVRALKAGCADSAVRDVLDEVTALYRTRRSALLGGVEAPEAAGMVRLDPRLGAGIGGPESPEVASCLHAYAAALLAAMAGWLRPARQDLVERARDVWNGLLPQLETSWCRDRRCARWSPGRRRAAIDVGTISVRLLVADVADGRPITVVRKAEVTRLGEGLEPGRSLGTTPKERTAWTVAGYVGVARANGAEAIVLAGTSATREARDGSEFIDALGCEHGARAVVLTGEREAELAHLGASLDIEGDPVVLDVGGGSTELTVRLGDGRIAPTSLCLGASRATDSWLGSDPPAPTEIAQVRAEAERLFSDARRQYGTGASLGETAEIRVDRRLVGVAGTVTTLAALDAGLEVYDPEIIHLRTLTLATVRRLVDRLAGLTAPERAALPCVQAGRAPVIVAGAVIVMAALETLGFGELTVSERDLLDGLVMHEAC